MGLLDLGGFEIGQNAAGEPIARAKLYVFAAGTRKLVPIYKDPALTETLANPLISNANGEFELCYLIDGEYKVEVSTSHRTLIHVAENVLVGASLARGGVRSEFRTVTEMCEDMLLDYTSSQTRRQVQYGDVLKVVEGGFIYCVEPPDTVDYHLETNGGVRLRVMPSSSAFNVKAFGAVGDGVTDDTQAIQMALNAAGVINNTAGTALGLPTLALYVPPGHYVAGSLSIAPGTMIYGGGRDSSVFFARSAAGETLFDVSRPSSITTSRTRNYTIRDLGLSGNNSAGSIGINLKHVAEIKIESVNIKGFDIGVDGFDIVTGKFDRCKLHANVTRAMRLLDGCNGIELSNTRLQTTQHGANLEIDGGFSFDTYGVQLNNCIIESALDAALGVGVIVGAQHAVLNVVFNGCYFEANEVGAIDIGSPTAGGTSYVTVLGGNFAAAGKPHAYGIRSYGAYLALINPWMEGISARDHRLVIETSAVNNNPRLWNVSSITPTGTARDLASMNGFATDTGLQAKDIRLGERASNYGVFTKRNNDVVYQGDNYLWVQTEFRTKWQGTALLSSGQYQVVFETPAANASYAVTLGSEGNNHLKINNKNIFGFTISAVDNTGQVQTGDSSRAHWHVFRDQ